MNSKATSTIIRRAAFLVLCLGIVMALLVFSNRERQPWNHIHMIGLDGQRIASIYAGQSGNQKFARLLRALPALAKARKANWKLMTSFQVHAASPSCATVKAALMKASEASESSLPLPNPHQCFTCYAEPTEYECELGCARGERGMSTIILGCLIVQIATILENPEPVRDAKQLRKLATITGAMVAS